MNRTNLAFLAIALAVLGLLLMQFLGQRRESGRLLVCQKRLMELGRANQDYLGNMGHYPPGTLGQPETVRWSAWNEADGESGWRRVANTSALGFLKAYLDTPSAHSLPVEMLSFDAQNFGWQAQADRLLAGNFGANREPAFLCPSDLLDDPAAEAARIVCASQPVQPDEEGKSLGVNDLGHQYWDQPRPLAPSNFLANGGASGGRCAAAGDPLAKFLGPFRSRSRTTSAMIVDGTSTTIMMGEAIGKSAGGKLLERLAWPLGGIGVARGDFDPESLVEVKSLESLTLLGNSQQSSARGFASRHPAGVNFVMLGGEFQVFTRKVSPVVLLSLSGMADGKE